MNQSTREASMIAGMIAGEKLGACHNIFSWAGVAALYAIIAGCALWFVMS